MIPSLQQLAGMDSRALQAAITEIDDQLATLDTDETGELRQLDAAEEKRLEKLVSLRSRVQAHLHIRDTFAKNPNSISTTGGPAVIAGRSETRAEEALRMGGDQLRSAALRTLEARGKELPAEAIDNVEKTLRSRLSAENPNVDGEYVARRMIITESPEYRSAFRQYMTDSQPLYTEGEILAVRAFKELESRALGEVTGSAGGFGVPTTIDPSILLSSGAADAPVLAAARVVPVTSNTWKGVTSAPPTFTFQTEAATVTDASPTLAQPSITVHMARSFLPYSFEVEQDYPGFETEIHDLLTQGWIDSIATKTITGSGTGEPFGILTKLDATGASEVRVTTAGTFDAQQVFRGWNALPERFRNRAKWLHSVSLESQIRSFGATPNPSSYFTVDLTKEGISRINGRETMVTDYMPTYVAGSTGTGNFTIVGDFSGYVIAMRQGLQVERVNHVVSGSPGMPTGQRGFLAWGRWGADAVVPGAFRLINQT